MEIIQEYLKSLPQNKIIGILKESNPTFLEQVEKSIATETDRIKFVSQFLEEDFLFETVEEQIQHWINCTDKKVEKALILVGLDASYRKRKVKYLSVSERKLLQLALCLLANPDVILFDEPMINFDLKNQKRLEKIWKQLVQKQKKTIIIASHDSNLLYQVTDYLIILKDGKYLKEGRTTELFEDVPFFEQHHLEIPDIVKFIYKAKTEKQVKLTFQRDIRDLIKDIYKHVDFQSK